MTDTSDENVARAIFIELQAKELNLQPKFLGQLIEFLEEGLSIPFVVRYRSAQIGNLDGSQGHVFEGKWRKHKSLIAHRAKILKTARESNVLTAKLRTHILSASSYGELDDLYLPFKPPAKGTLAQRASQIPGLSLMVTNLIHDGKDQPLFKAMSKDEKLKDSALVLISSHVSKTPEILTEFKSLFDKRSIISCKRSSSSFQSDKKTKTIKSNSDLGSLVTYENFSIPIKQLLPHQTLAISRGKDKGLLSINLVLETMESGNQIFSRKMRDVVPGWSKLSASGQRLVKEACEDAFNKSIKRRASGVVWKDRLQLAQKRSIEVFCDNLTATLLSPGLPAGFFVLSIDPGFRAGCKCALLNPDGSLFPPSSATSLFTIYPLQSQERSTSELVTKLQHLDQALQQQRRGGGGAVGIQVALGDGTGSVEARELVKRAIDRFHDIKAERTGDDETRALKKQKKDPTHKSVIQENIQITVVQEAGASVWSADQDAISEFPNIPAASLGAVSIGRRLQDPLGEYVKIPPKALGLGMYQHDLCPKALDAALEQVTVDCVAIVGVDLNSASEKLLSMVPGLTVKLARAVIGSRPFKSRYDLLKVKGIGPVAFKNCAGFLQVRNTDNVLDATLVHPDDYQAAIAILRALKLKTTDQGAIAKLQQRAKDQGWATTSALSLKVCGVESDWIRSIANQVSPSSLKRTAPQVEQEEHYTYIKSILTLMLSSCIDPRLINLSSPRTVAREDIPDFAPLKLRQSLQSMHEACPIRNVRGEVVNVTDFGAFIHLGQGSCKDGLLHRSQFPRSIQITRGQVLEVDISSVDAKRGRIEIRLPMKKRKHPL